MALERELPVWTASLALGEDVTTSTLLVRGGIDWLGASPAELADVARARLQGTIDKGGSPRTLLEMLPEIDGVRDATLAVDLPRRTDGAPATRVELPAAVVEARPGVWLALAPGLGATWPGATPEAALEGLRERVTLQLLAEDPRKDGAAFLDLVQGQGLTVAREERTFRFPTFAELREARKANKRLLPDVTGPFRVGSPTAFGLESTLNELERAVRAGRSVLVIGPNGSGKTALIRELGRVRLAAFGTIRETDAPGLLLGLMSKGAWQGPLATLAEELATEKTWLYVHHLAELYEVGRYEGNEVSLAEALRTAVSRGQARLLAEATPEEVATLEARYPGHLDGWTRVTVPAVKLDEVVKTWAASRGSKRPVRFQPDALAEVLRLHRRFTPYSGQPGKSLRFLASLALTLFEGTDPHTPLPEVSRDDVLDRFCAETGLARAIVDPRHPLPYAEIHAFFAARVHGQPAAVAAVAECLAAAKADVARWGKPLASLLLVGPTGVGKTETARAAAAFLFGDPARMVRFDMSEYATPAAVSRLVGGASGEGTLTGAVRRQPFSVVLFDEVEKAHPAFLDLLLQVMGEGRLTDGRGRSADFSSALVLLTSNVGAAEARRRGAGFTGGPGVEARFRDAVAAWLRPELLNRLDRVLTYGPLDPDAIARVLDRELVRFTTRPGLAGRSFTISAEARERLAQAGYRPEWGARALLRVVHDTLAAPVAVALDGWKEPQAPTVAVGEEGGRLVVRLRPALAGPKTGVEAEYTRARALQRRLRDLLEGAVFAEREAHLQILERRYKPGSRYGDPAPLRELLAGVQALVEDARRIEREVGLRALTGGDGATSDADFRVLERTVADRLRRLVESAEPATSIGIVGVYGREGVDELVTLYTSVGESVGLRVEARPLMIQGSGLHLYDPANPTIEALGDRVGVELRVTGSGAQLLYRGEEGVTLFQRPGGDARVRVLLVPTDRAGWERARPGNVHRKQFFSEPPRRVVGATVEDRDTRAWAPDLAAVGARIVATFTNRLFEALA